MSYSICNIIVGMPLTSELEAAFSEYEIDCTTLGFTGLYSAGGPNSGYCGVLLTEFDRGSDEKIADLLPKLVPTKDQIEEARAKLAETRVKLEQLLAEDDFSGWHEKEKKALVNQIWTEPETWLVWSDS